MTIDIDCVARCRILSHGPSRFTQGRQLKFIDGPQKMNSKILAWVCWSGCLALPGCFPHEAGPRLQHFYQEAPDVGTQAPVFNLVNLKGEQVSLKTLIGEKPVVLQFGSHSCPVYRYRRREMKKVYQEFHTVAHFVIVYTLEAHPVGTKSPYSDEEWVTWINRLTDVHDSSADYREGSTSPRCSVSRGS